MWIFFYFLILDVVLNYCSPGYYQSYGYCYGCPAGSYCPGGYTALKHYCAAGVYCPAYSSTSNGNGPCTAGYYCTYGSDRIACSGGVYCPEGSSTSNGDGLCTVGYYCASGYDRIECNDGYYCPEGSSTQTQCSARYYCPTPSSQISCSLGHYCSAGSTTQVQCSAGYYCPAGSASQTICPAGYYCEAGADRVQCPAGYYCEEGTQYSTIKSCPATYYCTEGTAKYTNLCPAGNYCPLGSANPTSCSKGYYCPSSSYRQIQCQTGTYQNLAGQAVCKACDPGYYCDSRGLTYQKICPKGKYCPLYNTIEPIDCDAGHYCPEGSSEQVLCDCSGHGNCTHEKDGISDCTCEEGYNTTTTDPSASPCGEFYCYGIHQAQETVCNGKGDCISTNLCSCYEGSSGDQCVDFGCTKGCSNGGACIGPNTCQCTTLFSGESCESLSSTFLVVILVSAVSLPSIIFIIILLFGLVCMCKLYKKAKIVDKIEDVDIILQEQKIKNQELASSSSITKSKTDTVAEVRIDKSLFKINSSDIQIVRKIGEGGGTGVIFLASWNKLEVAYKVFRVNEFLESSKFKEFEREVEVLCSVHFPYILNFYGATLEQNRVGFIMSYCKNGNIDEWYQSMAKNNNQITLLKRINMLIQISSAMNYLHSVKIIHRDLKSQNVLVDDAEDMKVMDFGGAKKNAVENDSKTKTVMVGTSLYMAPEVVVSGNYSFPCDVFSFGILMYVVLTGNFAPYGKNDFNVQMKVSSDPSYRPSWKGKECSNIPRKLKQLAESCWDHEPEDRKEFSEVYEFLKNFDLYSSQPSSGANARGRKIVKNVPPIRKVSVKRNIVQTQPPRQRTPTSPKTMIIKERPQINLTNFRKEAPPQIPISRKVAPPKIPISRNSPPKRISSIMKNAEKKPYSVQHQPIKSREKNGWRQRGGSVTPTRVRKPAPRARSNSQFGNKPKLPFKKAPKLPAPRTRPTSQLVLPNRKPFLPKSKPNRTLKPMIPSRKPSNMYY